MMKKHAARRLGRPAIALCLLLAACSAGVAAEYYVDDTAGDDSRGGQTPQAAWRTLARVNRADLRPGDVVRLKRGGTWRETLMPPTSGTAERLIVFEAYGDGPRPRILGSVDRSGEQLWTQDPQDANLWYTGDVRWEPNWFKLRQGMIFHDGIGAQQKPNRGDLANPWDWWIDAENARAYVRLDHNPGRHAIEVQQRNGVGFAGVSHVTVRGLEIAYTEIGIGIWQGDGWVIEDCDLHDAVVDLIHANGTAEDAPEGGIVRTCTFRDWNWKGHGLTQHNYQDWGRSEPFMGYGVHVFRGDDWQIVGNRLSVLNLYTGMDSSPIAFDDGGHATLIEGNVVDGRDRIFGPTTGIMLWATEGEKPVTIRGNVFMNLGGVGITIQEFQRHRFSAPVTVEDNVLIDVCTGDGIDQEAIRVWTKFAGAGLVTVRNNVVYRVADGQHEHHGIRVRESKAELMNNTVVGADRGVSVESGSEVVARGNVSTGNRASACTVQGGATLEESDNCWHGQTVGFTPAAGDVPTEPRLRDVRGGDFRTGADGPCAGRGATLQVPAETIAPAFEGEAP